MEKKLENNKLSLSPGRKNFLLGWNARKKMDTNMLPIKGGWNWEELVRASEYGQNMLYKTIKEKMLVSLYPGFAGKKKVLLKCFCSSLVIKELL